MSEIVCVFGSREKWWTHPMYVGIITYRTVLYRIPEQDVILVGGADGVDTWAEDAASHFGRQYRVERADWKTNGRAAGHARNRVMALACDRAIGIWDGRSPGTRGMIDLVKRQGKPLKMIYPEGGEP